MNNFFRWLKTRFAKGTPAATSAARYVSINELVAGKGHLRANVSPDCPPISDQEERQTAVNTYQCDDTIAQRQLNILQASKDESRQAADSDPYNNSDYDTAASWRATVRR